MAKIPFKYVSVDPDRHGNQRYYYRYPGARKIRLQGDPGTEAFTLSYWAARNGETIALAPIRTPARHGTFRWLAEHYLSSSEFRELNAKLTQPGRRRVIEAMIDKIGHLPAIIDPATIRAAVKPTERTPSQAKEFLAALRAVYSVGLSDELVSTNPAVGIKVKRPPTEGHRTWSPEDCKAYEACWPVGTKQRTAYAIGLYTGMRISDAVRIGRPHERGGRLRFTVQKNRKDKPIVIDIPVVQPLRDALDGWQGNGLTWIETEYGTPYSTPKGLQNKFREWCRKAGTDPACSFHGLRKAAGARMAEAGCTPHQIMAVLGHTTHQQAATYTAKAARAGLADDAMAAMIHRENALPKKAVG